MPKTRLITKSAIADWRHVDWALHRACLGKHRHAIIQRILQDPVTVINFVSNSLQKARLPFGSFHSFTIYDPKKRLIHAAPIEDRIAHHAIVSKLEPGLERVLLPSVFACRTGKGVHAAIAYAQRQSRRFRWVLHVDIKQYFPSIDHQILAGKIKRYFKGDGLQLIDAVIDSYSTMPGKGLPIGALTSQHFANHYLNIADRWSLAQPGIGAHCRYMDDSLFWSNDRSLLHRFQKQLTEFLQEQLALTIKPPLLQRTDIGLLFCGVHIKPFQLKPSLRRRRRYRRAVENSQLEWQRGEIDSLQLQHSYDVARAILLPADDQIFRRQLLAHCGVVDA